MGQLRVTEKALPSHNRRHNRSLVLQRLFHDGEMSRADLARISGLTAVTISDLVGDLHSEGLLLDLGPRVDARVGKPALVIAFDHGARSIVGLDLSADVDTLYRDGIVGRKGVFSREWAEAMREDMTTAFWEAIQRPGGAVGRGPPRRCLRAPPTGATAG